MEYALDENGTESRNIIEEEYKLLKETLEEKNELEYIYTVFKVYETLNNTISTNYILIYFYIYAIKCIIFNI